jgi:hypothetical protein
MFPRKNTPSGSPNPKYVDLLEEDRPIAQQKFVCVSFVSPENILEDKRVFMFDRFVRGWDLAKSIEKYAQFTAFLAYKYNLNSQQIQEDLNEFCKEESAALGATSFGDEFKTFLDRNEERLEAEFNTQHEFQTSVRGIKIRGTYATQEEAELRAKMLREADPNFDVYVGPVGLWMPWEPEAYKTGRVEYLEEELNELMAKKKSNEDTAKDYFTKRVKETKAKAMEENLAKAEQTGNKLTQMLSPDGELVGVANMNTQIASLDQVMVTPDVMRRKLFENDDVVLKK